MWANAVIFSLDIYEPIVIDSIYGPMRYVPHFDGRGTRGEVLVLRVAVGRHGKLNDAVLDGFDLSEFKEIYRTNQRSKRYRTNQRATYKDPFEREIYRTNQRSQRYTGPIRFQRNTGQIRDQRDTRPIKDQREIPDQIKTNQR